MHICFVLNLASKERPQTVCCMCFKVMSQRLYIGGLFHGVTEVELKERFGKFGSINNVSIKTKEDGNGNGITFLL